MTNPNQGQKQSLDERINGVFGEDPTKSPKLTSTVFTKVLEKRAEKRREQAEKEAEGLLDKLAELQTRKVQARRAFEKTAKEIEKEEQKLVNQIENALKGVEPAPETEAGEGEKTEEAKA